MMDALARLGFEPVLEGDRIGCTVPVHRLDIEREIDLIEEVGRMYGHDNVPVTDTIRVRVAPPQPTELAKQAIADELIGMGFVETVTHSLVSEKDAESFLPPGAHPLRVADDRAKAAPVLQPSVLPSLLRVRRLNQDNGVHSLRLFESAATFIGREDGGHEETTTLGLLMDLESEHDGLRPMRGAIQLLAETVLGRGIQLQVEADTDTPWLAPGAKATAAGEPIGRFGVLAQDVVRRFGLDTPVLVAELDLPRLYDRYPPISQARGLPSFPAIERDVSAIVDEMVTWAQIEAKVEALGLDFLEAAEFITTFHGRQVPRHKKSLTFRLRFRADDRTLKHEEVDGQVESVMAAVQEAFGAEIRH
jgi:phenylalanyl-tRNA synthetase beta chain